MDSANSTATSEVPQLYVAAMTATGIVNTSDVAMRTTPFLSPYDGDIRVNVLFSNIPKSVLSTFNIAKSTYPEILLSKHLLPPRQEREFYSPPPDNAVRPTAFNTNTDEHDLPIISSSAGSWPPVASAELIIHKNLCLKCNKRPQGFFWRSRAAKTY